MKKYFLSILIVLVFVTTILSEANLVIAQSSTSTNYQINNPVVSSGSENSSSTNFKVGQSISQSITGRASSTNFQLWSGFQYFFKANSNTLSSTAGDSSVNLSWTVPQTFLGVSVGTYEVGVGTISGTYTYENVGNITSFNKSGLSNGTQYFFKIKSKTLGGTILTYSNESSATPSSTNSNQNNNGGGGGSYGTEKINFSGTAYPNAEIFLLKDASLVSNTTADTAGNFSISLTGLSSGNFDFAIYAKDPQGRRSNLSFISASLTNNQTKNISDILIPPTIALNNLEVKQGEVENIFGFAQKNSKVTIVLSYSPTKTFEVKSGPEGFYSFNLPTSKLNLGSYNVFSKTFFNNLFTPNSTTLQFKVGTKTIQNPNLNGCPTKGDLNSDCRVDLVDFSILAFWYLKPNFPSEIDFNNDGMVDLIDFSILAYNWTG